MGDQPTKRQTFSEILADMFIDKDYEAQMHILAQAIDDVFNGSERPKRTCFVLLVAPFGTDNGRANYISNGNRADCINLMKEYIARAEGQKQSPGG